MDFLTYLIQVGSGMDATEKMKSKTFGSKKAHLPPIEAKPSAEDILNSILPPREWVENGKHYIQYVSNQPASRVDVARLRELLDEKLMERQARESGICPVREELFSQCFDEIIRQVTLNEAERGLLLLRVRDEIKMTISAYQTLYQSAVTFGMRKQLQAEHGKAELESKIDELEARKIKLENKVIELKSKIEAIENRNKERKEIEQKKRDEEIEFLKYQESHLAKFLKSLTDQK
jgi:dynein light intermediate chain